MLSRIFRLAVSRRWGWTTLLVLAGIALTVRLGIWQVSRYHQNKSIADHMSAMQSAPALDLKGLAGSSDLLTMEYRPVEVTGTFDYASQIAIRNQVWQQSWGNQIGYILITPLILSDGSAVMVDRGWIPAQDGTPESWRKYDAPNPVTVKGILRLATRSEFGGVADPVQSDGQKLLLWNRVDLARLQKQVTYPLLPVYIQEAPDPAFTSMPYREELAQPDTSAAGRNVGYAFTWFAFSLLLIGGYPLYLHRQSGSS